MFDNIKRLDEKELAKLSEQLARSSNNRIISDPISKAHLLSDYVIVWWFNRGLHTKKPTLLLSKEGREVRHRDLSHFPEIDADPSWCKGRVFRWEGKLYNCVYDLVTVPQLLDLTSKLEDRYKFSIDHTVDNMGDEIVI